ncbi:AAA family ATPase [Dyadobacter sp. CY323]|uniref:AAA family ATPase n=1 Tax=Dyadobacter sp. CY323 TaxID=2907302 RepID=UPI001F326B23|nr:AAA family ATPase [Dyadobacter sp. CY323]MCE6992928.1 AAA family ATPase [Dyadobacter sp. CY323]
MPTLYIDNFRGFTKTFLSFSDMNFFVGENSTGKTSLIKLIGILSSNDFWNYQQFGSDSTELGEFVEIANSTQSINNEQFEVAFFEENHDLTDFIAIRLKFIEQDTKPEVKEIKLINGPFEIQISIQGLFAKYRIISRSRVDSEKYDDNLEIFKNWINSIDLSKSPFQSIRRKGKGLLSLFNDLNSEIRKFNTESEIPSFVTPSFFTNCAWFSPSRENPKKTYDSPILSFDSQGRHIPYIFKKYLEDDPISQHIIDRFGSDSGLYDAFSVKSLSKSLQTEPFQMVFNLNGSDRNITSVGYGVSQIFPIVVEVIARFRPTWFAIQQPEIHLHPRAQAAFGDFLFKSDIEDKHRFIVETHSDFIIDRYRIRLNKYLRKNGKPVDSTAQVIFFSRSKEGNSLTTITINPDGSYSDDQPDDFRNFFIREQLDLINI